MAVIWPQNLQIKPNSSVFSLYLLHPSLQWTHIHTETPSERQQFGIWSFCLGTTEFWYVIRCNGCLNMRTNSSGWTHIAALTSNRMLFELKMEHQQKLVVTYSANRPPIFPSIFSMEIFTLNANIFLSEFIVKVAALFSYGHIPTTNKWLTFQLTIMKRLSLATQLNQHEHSRWIEKSISKTIKNISVPKTIICRMVFFHF